MKTMEVSHSGIGNVLLGKFLGILAFAVLMCFSALIKVPLPFTPVPVTLQNFVVFLAGAILGAPLGIAAVGLYITVGFLGAPLFANTGWGIIYLSGPTGGYLLGFLAAAWFIGYFLQNTKTKNIVVLYTIMLAGAGIIYCLGGLWLKIGYGWDFEKIFFLGVAPFLAPDLIKAFVAALIYKNLPYQRR